MLYLIPMQQKRLIIALANALHRLINLNLQLAALIDKHSQLLTRQPSTLR